jgi:dienelactone hydrolase
MRILRILAVAGTTGLVAMSGGLAQSPETSQPSSEALQAARNLVALVSPATITQMASDVTAKVWPRIEAAMRSKYSKIDDATLGELRGEYERLVSETVAETMNGAPVIYVRYFTAAEMKEIAAFYSTPTDAKTLTVMPKVMADIVPALLPRLQPMEAQLNANFSNILKKHGLAVAAQELVHFPSFEDNGPGRSSTVLNGYLSRPTGEGQHPAVIFLHGCGGLLMGSMIEPGESDWAGELTRRGYAVLMVDSFAPRDRREMCAPRTFDLELYRNRARDAYGALLFLQAQPFVRPDRIGIMGWSQGGGALLFAIGTQSFSRPAQLPRGDFRAAVAFYPSWCDEQRQQPSWSTTIPLMILIGAEDVGIPAVPCKALLDGAVTRGAKVEMQIYPGAYDHFDWPNLPRRELPFPTAGGVVRIEGTDTAARQDAFSRVPSFLARFLTN